MTADEPTLVASSPDAELWEFPDGTWLVKARVGTRFVVDDLWPTDPRPDSKSSLLALAAADAERLGARVGGASSEGVTQ